MRHDKATVVIELARRMAGSAEGLTLDDMARDLDVGRRTAERLRDAVLMLFPGAEEVSDPPSKRWRIRGGLSAFEQAPTTTELVELNRAALALRRADEPVRDSTTMGRSISRTGVIRLRSTSTASAFSGEM